MELSQQIILILPKETIAAFHQTSTKECQSGTGEIPGRATLSCCLFLIVSPFYMNMTPETNVERMTLSHGIQERAVENRSYSHPRYPGNIFCLDSISRSGVMKLSEMRG